MINVTHVLDTSALLAHYFNELTVCLPVDRTVAELAWQLEEAIAERIPLVDALIAATARAAAENRQAGRRSEAVADADADRQEERLLLTCGYRGVRGLPGGFERPRKPRPCRGLDPPGSPRPPSFAGAAVGLFLAASISSWRLILYAAIGPSP